MAGPCEYFDIKGNIGRALRKISNRLGPKRPSDQARVSEANNR